MLGTEQVLSHNTRYWRIMSTGRRIPFWEAFRFWLKLGFISFGGPAGQIAIMHKELVDRRRWLGEERFLHALNYCMLLPGPEAHQLAIYIGWLLHRVWGGIVAGVFFVVPSIFVLLGLSYIYAAHGAVPAVAGVLDGFKPVVVAIVVEALLKIGKRSLKARAHYTVAALAFVSIFFLHVPFPVIVLVAGLIGLFTVRYFPTFIAPSIAKSVEAELPSANDLLPLAISDHGELPPHTKPSRRRLFQVMLIGVGLWVIPFAVLLLCHGWDSLHIREYTFFTQAALVTFGGAYAVLAYVTQAVTQAPFNWLTPGQAIDGLALAETTPGPLIMVLQFVGFMAGWNNPVGGLSPTASAILGALVTTYVTFLPSFLFIFLGAPYIEYLRGSKVLTGSLSMITAAVVGVILNLALVFGLAVIAPHGLGGPVNWVSGLLSIFGFIALFRFKIDVLWVVLAGGFVGLIRAMLA